MAARSAALPQKPGSGAPTANAGAPNQTLYIRNLNQKINRDDLKRALYMLFSTYGPVLDIVSCRVSAKGQQMRGQAHVCFRDIQTSTQAMRSLQGFEIFGKEMSIQYARGTSDIIPKLRGTFEPPTAPAPATEATEVQKSIFNAPPSSIPTKPTTNGVLSTAGSGPQGTKRLHEEIEEEEEDQDDVAMEEDDDDDAPMEEDDDDD